MGVIRMILRHRHPQPRRTHALPRLVIVLAAISLMSHGLAGCASDPTVGYSTRSTYTTQVRTVALPIFENATFDRGVEFDLADALVKEIEARTPYKVTSPERADTVLSGSIRSVRRDAISKSRLTGLSEEVVLGVTVDFVWKEQRTGRVLLERTGFAAQGLFLPSPPSGEPVELAEFAAVQQLARDIVGIMRSDW